MTRGSSFRHTSSLLAAFALAVGGLTLFNPPAHAVPAPLALSVAAEGTNIHTVVLNWVAPYDNASTSTGRAKAYDVRYSTSPITTANFDAATQADMTIAPQPAGDAEMLYVNNLSDGVRYYFAGKTIATDGSTSTMSNVVDATTGPQPGVVQQVTVTNLADLQTQINNAPPQGVVITLAKGDYQESQTIELAGKNNITIQGETSNPADTIIRGEGMNGGILHNIYINASSYVTVKNLTLRDTYYHAIQVANGSQYFHADNIVGWNNGEAAFKISAGEWGVEGTDQYSDYGLIENCHIGFDTNGVRSVIEGIDGVAAKGWVVRNNVAENIRYASGSVAYAMFFKGNSIDSVFENNVVINSDIGISFGDGSTGYQYFRYGDTSFEHRGGIIANNVIKSTSADTGIVLRGATGFKVYNNTVWNTDSYYYNSISLRVSDVQIPAGYPAPQPTQNGEIVNNIFRFAIEPDYGTSNQQLSSTIVKQNNLAGGQSVASGLDPSLFVDAAGGDFHLTSAATAAIGQGANLHADVPTDFDGVARPATGAFDIGAYQYTAAPACVGVNGSLTSNDSLVPWSGNGGYDATHYSIDLTYNPPVGGTPATIDATTTINATVTGAPLCSFGLDLLGLTVSSVTVDGTSASFARIQDAATNMYKLVVTPTHAVTGDFTVAVSYSGQPQQFSFAGSSNFAVGWLPNRAFSVGGTNYPADGGGVGLGEPVGAFAWYPVNATPADKASYTTSLTAPNEFSAVAIGSLVSTTAVGADQTRWTWDEPDAVPSSFTIAAIGKYQADTDTHTTPGGTVVPIGAYTDPALTNGGQVPAHYIDLTKQLLDWGENYFGPYQPAVAGYVMKPIAVSYALEVYGKPFYTADWGDSTYIHEFAHQWGGNSVSVADWSDLWLAEGFATYMPWLWNEDHGGASVNDQAMNVYNLPDTNSLWSVAPAGMTTQSQMFGNWNYDGGALALAALRQGIGPDLMQQVMYAWFTQNAGGNASTQDFIALAESVSGTDLTQWANDYLFTAGKPPSWPAPLSYLPAPSLSSISVTTQPAKTTYMAGDALNLTGMVVTATYSNATTADVTASVTTDPAAGTIMATPGNQSVTISYTEGGVTRTASVSVTVNLIDLSSATVTVSGPAAYTGAALTPTVTVSLGGIALVQSQDYTVTYYNNTNAGTATVTITGAGNYTGTITQQFTISPRVITFNIDALPDHAYTGAPITPPVVARDGTTPVPTTDYTVSYTNNVNVGTATVNITGTGNYAGSTGTTTFTITGSAPPVPDQVLTFDSTDVTKTFGDPPFTNQLTHVGGGALSFTSTNPAVASVDSAGQVTILATGSVSITVVAAAVPGQWAAASASYTLTVVPQSLAGANVTLVASMDYTGGPLTPTVVVTVGGQALVQGSDFTVAYTDNTNPGQATVTITGIGNYSGQSVNHFTIVVTPTLSLDMTAWPAPAGTSNTTVAVTTNQTGLTASSNQTWLTVSVVGTTITLTADANPTGLPRTATVTVQVAGLQKTLTVTQAGVGSASVSHDGAPITTAQIGWTVTGIASGFHPGESVQGSMHSFPLSLGTQIADTNGQVQFTWVIPADTPAGTHTFVATATTLAMQAAFTVPAAQPPANGGTSVTVETGGSPATNSSGAWAVTMLITALAVLALWRRYRVLSMT
ncbi:MAG: bacterial Ig-like domain-containing protein [Propionibacteriaceae bacterium]|nr:bacterial Ig-like domain-containing protein [Propionibacteriaceae bacterium]